MTGLNTLYLSFYILLILLQVVHLFYRSLDNFIFQINIFISKGDLEFLLNRLDLQNRMVRLFSVYHFNLAFLRNPSLVGILVLTPIGFVVHSWTDKGLFYTLIPILLVVFWYCQVMPFSDLLRVTIDRFFLIVLTRLIHVMQHIKNSVFSVSRNSLSLRACQYCRQWRLPISSIGLTFRCVNILGQNVSFFQKIRSLSIKLLLVDGLVLSFITLSYNVSVLAFVYLI